MTNHWIDIQHADVILCIGSNPAENHPISFKYVEKAMDNGARLISVDPRYTRTSSKADTYAQLRPGTDIAFIGGMINHILQNDLIHRDYVVNYTNASFLISDEYAFNDGIFSGYDAETFHYENDSWAYQLGKDGLPLRDNTLEHPASVYQLLKNHYRRYTPEKVCEITGTAIQDYMEVTRTFCATGRPDRVATIMYAMGTTQHTYGTQNVRSYAMLQLLLGNIGMAGGGINALRGEANVQGSTDYAILYHILPGYLKSPVFDNVSLAAYNEKWTPKTKDPKSANWWANTPKYMASLLKAYWGDAATAENGFCYDYLPKRSGNYSFIKLMERLQQGRFEGLVCMGTNPIVGGPDASAIAKGLDKLQWMVAADLWETETSVFWKRPGVDPKTIDTEVFLLPAAASVEKEGSISNSGRWAQWRYKAVEPPGDAESDAFIVDGLVKNLKALYAEGGVFPGPIVDLDWNYGQGHEPDIAMVARECNGQFTRDTEIKGKLYKKGEQVPSFAFLQDDGATTSGNWLYCGSYTEAGNMMQRRGQDDPTGMGSYHNWSWCWPVNRRVLYNRASVDLNGRPWNPKKPVIAWNALTRKWEGDVPDGGWAPMSEDGTKHPFIMIAEGHARLFAAGLADGPMPEHYEPMESPVANSMTGQQCNPAVAIPGNIDNSGRYPYIGTTYRVSEHWQAGAMTRNLPWLVELVPEMFVEISEELAKWKGIANGEMVTISSPRGTIEAKALVTARIKPLRVGGKMIEQVGLPWHFGFNGLATGGSANVLTTAVGCANTSIPEYKAFLCNLEKGGIKA
ncbi:periplasmically oriented, membrane-bound formate dehydrogenase, major subunit [Desulfuromonas soudanensis]|uniref:Periplasmically oriented, membrane-bound formate dehydrogenase, major subunit n=3 Tax=Desulfuromonas soudanensis TaxID=1603606 RepID=A0A0M3QFD1_9BACT|nr:periplasmically oriented, membrane-bound formate dehydrogenase, major subunit [Desulfuromonas soudanensis]